MAAVLVATGQVRGVTVARKKKKADGSPGDRFGQRVSLLTEVPGHFGDTLEVLLFDPDEDAPLAVSAGEIVEWVVSVESNNFGLNTRFLATVEAAGRLAEAA